ncbi:MAG TPA: hypothetical protein VF049_04315 [Nocardioidaceae bacterium]|jgi:hypothetical protein
MTDPVVKVWRQDDGLWRWCWENPAESGSESEPLVSHKAFHRQEEAVKSAREAYPDLLPEVSEEHRAKGGCGRAVLVALVVAAALTRRRSTG